VSLIVHVDGGARGNPGPAGAGVVIADDAGRKIFEGAFFLGTQTNNTAEYLALLHALERIGRNAGQTITVHSDSELLVRQLTGEYRVKNPRLAELHGQVQIALLKVSRWTVRHIAREQNHRADELANLAMDRRRNVIVFDADAAPGTPPPDEADCPADPEPGPPPRRREAAPPAGRPQVRVTVVRPPKTGTCPAAITPETCFTIDTALPAGLCVRAAHTLVPTILAILNSDPEERAGIPTLTVRCMHAGCGAEFHVTPVRSSNGETHE
jgi:ribonuclease HI